MANTQHPSRLPPHDHPRLIHGAATRRPSAEIPAAKRYHYHRRHTPHFYLVISALSCATGVCVLKGIAFVNRSVPLATFSFFAVLLTALVVSAAFFWGFTMVMNGNIPTRRLKVLLPHAALGVLSPLLYTLNVSVDYSSVGNAPIGALSLGISLFCLLLLCVQFRMGRAVVRPEPLRLLRGGPRTAA